MRVWKVGKIRIAKRQFVLLISQLIRFRQPASVALIRFFLVRTSLNHRAGKIDALKVIDRRIAGFKATVVSVRSPLS